uniref:Uncharacterized protein n=1 Tax=Acanthochromis polyacanthus TaxID=80966 RepID=A0A3Q1GSK9_9TELE
MAFLIKSMIGNPLSGMGLGGGGDKEEEATPSDPAKAAGMTREEYEEYQKQLVEENVLPAQVEIAASWLVVANLI